MVDRVARRLFDLRWTSLDNNLLWAIADRTVFYDQPRAAIAAMREPTEAMVVAHDKCRNHSGAAEWHAMIDEALK